MATRHQDQATGQDEAREEVPAPDGARPDTGAGPEPDVDAGPEPAAGLEPGGPESAPGPEPAGRRWPRFPWRALAPALPLLLYTALALLLFRSAWSSPTTRTLSGGGGDPAIFIWFLRWVPYALGHGLDPLVTHHLNYPDGVNLMWNTTLPLLGLLLAPLTLAFGPVLTFNVVATAGYALSAWCAYLAFRRFAPGHLAAAVGGLIYGFSPAIRGQSSHPHMSLAFLVPLMFLALHEILVRQRRSPWLVGALLGLMAACQLLIGSELLAMAGLFGFAMFLLVVVTNLRRLRERARVAHTLKAFAAALVVFAALAAWPLAVQFTGDQRVSGDVQKTNRPNALGSYVIPGGGVALTTDAAVETVRRFPSGGNAYLGLPLVLVLVALAVRWWSKAVVRIGLALLLLAAALSMGPSLYVGGRDTGIWMPWAFFENMPLLDSLIPARLAQLTALFAGLLLAVFLSLVGPHPGRRRRQAAVATVLAAAVLAPLWPAVKPPASKVATPAFFRTDLVRQLPRDGSVLVLPYPNRSVAFAMTWQAEAGLWFRMPGGYFIGPTPDGKARFDATPNSAAMRLHRIYKGVPTPPLTKPWRRVLAEDFASWRVRGVVVGPMPNQAAMVAFMTDLLGKRPEQVGGVFLWRDPAVVLSPDRRSRA